MAGLVLHRTARQRTVDVQHSGNEQERVVDRVPVDAHERVRRIVGRRGARNRKRRRLIAVLGVVVGRLVRPREAVRHLEAGHVLDADVHVQAGRHFGGRPHRGVGIKRVLDGSAVAKAGAPVAITLRSCLVRTVAERGGCGHKPGRLRGGRAVGERVLV